MERQKALAVLKEILDTIEQRAGLQSIILDDQKGDFSLKLQCCLNNDLNNCLQPILTRERLQIKQVASYLIIHE